MMASMLSRSTRVWRPTTVAACRMTVSARGRARLASRAAVSSLKMASRRSCLAAVVTVLSLLAGHQRQRLFLHVLGQVDNPGCIADSHNPLVRRLPQSGHGAAVVRHDPGGVGCQAAAHRHHGGRRLQGDRAQICARPLLVLNLGGQFVDAVGRNGPPALVQVPSGDVLLHDNPERRFEVIGQAFKARFHAGLQARPQPVDSVGDLFVPEEDGLEEAILMNAFQKHAEFLSGHGWEELGQDANGIGQFQLVIVHLGTPPYMIPQLWNPETTLCFVRFESFGRPVPPQAFLPVGRRSVLPVHLLFLTSRYWS